MTMPTNSLPIQAAIPGAQAQNLRANATLPNDGVNFGATLTRQIEQRQLEARQAQPQQQPQSQPAMAPPAALAGPKPQAAAKPAANEAKAPAREGVKEASQAGPAAPADKAAPAEEQTAAAEGGDAAEAEAAAAPDATLTNSVVDMLALVASFRQAQPVAPSGPDAAASPAAQPGALLDALKDKPGLGTEPALQDAGEALTSVAAGQAQGKAEPGIDLRAPGAGKAADAAQLPLQAGDFAAKLRDTVAQAAAKEPLPTAAALNSLAAQATALQGAQAGGSLPTDRLSARVGTPAWDNQVGQKVIWMVGGADQSATLELNPPDLGPVQVVLNVSNDMASVTFSSSQLEVRQALENAMPRLREMMSESGIALGNATVNAGAEGRQGQDGQGSSRPGNGKGGKGSGGDSAVAEIAPRQRTGMIGGAGAVDTFA